MTPLEERRGRELLSKWKRSGEPIRVVLSFDGMVTFTGFGIVKEALDKEALFEGKGWSLLLEFAFGRFGETVSEEMLLDTPSVDAQSEATTFIFATPNDKCFLASLSKKGGKPN